MVHVSGENQFSRNQKSKICPRNNSQGTMVRTLIILESFQKRNRTTANAQKLAASAQKNDKFCAREKKNSPIKTFLNLP
jgi:hypothetical protein